MIVSGLVSIMFDMTGLATLGNCGGGGGGAGGRLSSSLPGVRFAFQSRRKSSSSSCFCFFFSIFPSTKGGEIPSMRGTGDWGDNRPKATPRHSFRASETRNFFTTIGGCVSSLLCKHNIFIVIFMAELGSFLSISTFRFTSSSFLFIYTRSSASCGYSPGGEARRNKRLSGREIFFTWNLCGILLPLSNVMVI